MPQTVEKTAPVLNLFTPQCPEWGVTQIAAELGWPKSSTHDLLASPSEVGLLYRVATGRYRLGFRPLTLSQALLHNTPWREVAQVELQRLRSALGESVDLCVLARGQVVTVTRLDVHWPETGTPSKVGSVPPVHTTAHGKALLCARPWAFVNAVLAQHGRPAFTPNTITSRDELRSELRRVRERGMATDIEEMQEERCMVSASVHNHNGEIIAGFGVTLGSARHDAARMGCARRSWPRRRPSRTGSGSTRSSRRPASSGGHRWTAARNSVRRGRSVRNALARAWTTLRSSFLGEEWLTAIFRCAEE
ncbi:IclR family transcriptional regulator [Deinococcus sp.]|uniref:IclR family transcriptional regulator n=1 Tax=Deinococcus sp. TaxID=47478 RepID=UPI0028699631|nr:IclR family transcriptional regulator [Deinococcus sp.]